jgi:hypothetical protein
VQQLIRHKEQIRNVAFVIAITEVLALILPFLDVFDVFKYMYIWVIITFWLNLVMSLLLIFSRNQYRWRWLFGLMFLPLIPIILFILMITNLY